MRPSGRGAWSVGARTPGTGRPTRGPRPGPTSAYPGGGAHGRRGAKGRGGSDLGTADAPTGCLTATATLSRRPLPALVSGAGPGDYALWRGWAPGCGHRPTKGLPPRGQGGPATARDGIPSCTSDSPSGRGPRSRGLSPGPRGRLLRKAARLPRPTAERNSLAVSFAPRRQCVMRRSDHSIRTTVPQKSVLRHRPSPTDGAAASPRKTATGGRGACRRRRPWRRTRR